MDNLICAKGCLVKCYINLSSCVRTILSILTSIVSLKSTTKISTVESSAMESISKVTVAAIVASSGLASESSTKDIFQDVIHISHISAFKMIFMEGSIRITVRISTSTRSAVSICSGSTCSCCAIKCCMTELIIHFLLFRIAEDIVSFCCFLEFLFCLWIVFVRIRMISLRQLTISFFNRIFIGCPVYTKDIIIIPLR